MNETSINQHSDTQSEYLFVTPTTEEIRVWAASLARTREAQLRIMRDLLRYAARDEKRDDDRAFIMAAVEALR